MALSIHTFIQGPLQNNVYLLLDEKSRKAVVIDPASEAERLAKWLIQEKAQLSEIWLTHAHFDHIAGCQPLIAASGSEAPLRLHPADLPIFLSGGMGPGFGIPIQLPNAAPVSLRDGEVLRLGDTDVIVKHTPGHTPGHVVFAEPQAGWVICGDLIFQGGVGRTDLPGGNARDLLESIQHSIFTLPDETRLYPGHGPSSTVGHERAHNPFVLTG